MAQLNENSGERVPLVPLLYRSVWNEKQVRALQTGVSQFSGAQEGYVVRLARSFTGKDWPRSIAKYVRPNHVQTGQHWMLAPIERNGLVP